MKQILKQKVPNPSKLRKEHIIHAPHQRQKLGYVSNISFDSLALEFAIEHVTWKYVSS